MPLDTQPLSRPRRLLMLAVLLALFGGSLAFAQYLVIRTHKPPFMATSLRSFGFTTPEQQTYADQIEALSGLVDQHPRRIDLFAWDQPAPLTPSEQLDAAEQIFLEIAKIAPQQTSPARLAGVNAVQVTGGNNADHFALVRLAQVDEHLVAICYSGLGPYTDADKAMFNTVCTAGIRFSAP
jgi:hypothetical protein